MLSRVLAEVAILGIRVGLAFLVMEESAHAISDKLNEVARALGAM